MIDLEQVVERAGVPSELDRRAVERDGLSDPPWIGVMGDEQQVHGVTAGSPAGHRRGQRGLAHLGIILRRPAGAPDGVDSAELARATGRRPPDQRQLVATAATEIFEQLTGWFNSLEAASAVMAVLILANKSGAFQCRLGIQTATDDANPPVTLAAYPTQISTAPTRTFMRFDPNGPSDGNIDTAAAFRIGIWYSLSAGRPPRTATSNFAGCPGGDGRRCR